MNIKHLSARLNAPSHPSALTFKICSHNGSTNTPYSRETRKAVNTRQTRSRKNWLTWNIYRRAISFAYTHTLCGPTFQWPDWLNDGPKHIQTRPLLKMVRTGTILLIELPGHAKDRPNQRFLAFSNMQWIWSLKMTPNESLSILDRWEMSNEDGFFLKSLTPVHCIKQGKWTNHEATVSAHDSSAPTWLSTNYISK